VRRSYTSQQSRFTATVQHVGERFTQLVDQAPGVGQTNPDIVDIGAPTSTDLFVDPELPSYELVNVRLGAQWTHGMWRSISTTCWMNACCNHWIASWVVLDDSVTE